MQELVAAWDALKFGGPMVYPLVALGILALIIILDRSVAYSRSLKLPDELVHLIGNYKFSWDELNMRVEKLGPSNVYGRFLGVITENRGESAWWVESRASDEIGSIEKVLNRGLWILETVVTAAPLMGLFGTITGMMEAFDVIGTSGLVAPHEVTAGVAQALIATALGLLIAILSLFGFNFFSKTQSHALDLMERLGSKLVDHIRRDEQAAAASPLETAPSVARGAAR
jgi:biopolymer transport protein ExbB